MYDASEDALLFTALEPHPRWRWRGYALRWLVGGFWSLWHLPLRGTLYGTIFFLVAYSWSGAFTDFGGSGVALATALTGLTLLLAPRLTAGLFGGLGQLTDSSSENEERRQAALIGLGSLLVMILSIGFNSILASFLLLYSGDMPPLDGLFQAVVSWQNALLGLLLLGLIFIIGLSVQLAAVLPTFALLQQSESDLFRAVRSALAAVHLNWRPLACWSLTSQLLLFAGAGLLPLSLVLLAPAVACGSWWACRDMSCRGRAIVL